jgi:DNA-nicking Smr family endonuclease
MGLGDLARVVRDAGITLRSHEPPSPPPPPTPVRPAPPAAAPDDAKGEDDLFAEAMREVARAPWSGEHREVAPAVPSAPPPSESEDLRLMQAAVDGIPRLEPGDHPEYIEGWIGLDGRRLLPGLRAGTYSIQGQLDLHGLDREEAHAAVEDFVPAMCRFRSCCVKIIHGRGINSPGDRAVLKESLQRWLSTRRMGRHVVAYASAPNSDGGVGAVYVLLRRAR